MADLLCVDSGAVANTWDDPDDPCPSRCGDCMKARMLEVTHRAEERMRAISSPIAADLIRELNRERDELVSIAGIRPHFADMFVAQAATGAALTLAIKAPMPWHE